MAMMKIGELVQMVQINYEKYHYEKYPNAENAVNAISENRKSFCYTWTHVGGGERLNLLYNGKCFKSNLSSMYLKR